MRISDWSSDVFSSDLAAKEERAAERAMDRYLEPLDVLSGTDHEISAPPPKLKKDRKKLEAAKAIDKPKTIWIRRRKPPAVSRSEEHTSELQSLMRSSYAVFCLKKKKTQQPQHINQLTAQTKN